MNSFKKALAVFSAVLMVVLSVLPCFASQTGDAQQGRLTVAFFDGEKPISHAPFFVFFVAKNTSEPHTYTPADDFSSYPVNWTLKDTEMLKNTAVTLWGYAARDGVEPVYTGRTDENGVLRFSEENGTLRPGLYLITAGRVMVDGNWYFAAPCLVQVPELTEELNEWSGELRIIPKFDRVAAQGEKKTTDCSVILEWHGDEKNLYVRPRKVEITLLKDGEVFDRVELNEKNSWRHTWKDLDVTHSWVVVEEENDDYQVLVRLNETTFFIDNTYYPVAPPGEETTAPGEEKTTAPGEEKTTAPGEEKTTAPGEEKTTAPGEEKTTAPGESSEDTPKLPDTGMLWWPVTVFSVAGLLLFLTGWGLLRKYE